MATHSSVLAWRIPGRWRLVGCCLWGHTESDTTEATQQQQQQLIVLSLRDLKDLHTNQLLRTKKVRLTDTAY